MDDGNLRKVCFKCNEEKPLSDFYRHPRMADGHLGKCKECAKRDVTERREANIEYVREYDRKRARTPKRIELHARTLAIYRREHPERVAANNAAQRAVASGKIKRKDRCELCGVSGRLEKHHPDYDQPLWVFFLCPVCHKAVHYGKAVLPIAAENKAVLARHVGTQQAGGMSAPCHW